MNIPERTENLAVSKQEHKTHTKHWSESERKRKRTKKRLVLCYMGEYDNQFWLIYNILASRPPFYNCQFFNSIGNTTTRTVRILVANIPNIVLLLLLLKLYLVNSCVNRSRHRNVFIQCVNIGHASYYYYYHDYYHDYHYYCYRYGKTVKISIDFDLTIENVLRPHYIYVER